MSCLRIPGTPRATQEQLECLRKALRRAGYPTDGPITPTHRALALLASIRVPNHGTTVDVWLSHISKLAAVKLGHAINGRVN